MFRRPLIPVLLATAALATTVLTGWMLDGIALRLRIERRYRAWRARSLVLRSSFGYVV